MDSPNQKEFTFDEIKTALLDNASPFPTQMVYFFSDISTQNLRSLKEVWPQIWLDRRRGLLEDMENMAEADTLLFFDNVALMALDDEDPVARSTAIRLLWQSEEEKLALRLLTLLVEDPNPIVRAAAATGLGIFVYLGELEEISAETFNKVMTGLIEAHRGSDEVLVRRRALEALGYASHPDVPVFIQQAYESNDEDWLQTALFAMGRSCDQERYARMVLRMFEHPDMVVRYEAIRAAGELELTAAREVLFDLLEEGTDDDDIYFAAIWALSKIGGQGVRNLIEMNLEEAVDAEELQLLEEALENLDFTEQVNSFDLMLVDEDDPSEWVDENGDSYTPVHSHHHHSHDFDDDDDDDFDDYDADYDDDLDFEDDDDYDEEDE
ncbi:HEAT repeat domain-containing protein [Chloroflexota bacterium]|nr:HEAT repeat domain-containing protein [Chloroflexota bacterium]